MDDRQFVELFAQALTDAGTWQQMSPVRLVESWEELVADAERGYGWNFDEYLNDLAVRDLVGRVLDNPKLRDVPQMGWVRERIDAADRKFRSAVLDQPVRDDSVPWWRAHVPKRAGEELAADLLARYGVRVEVVDL